MTGLSCAATPAGTVTLDIASVVTPLFCPAWNAWEQGVRRCRQMARKRGKDRLINGLAGRRPYGRQIDEWTFDMDMTFIGHADPSGTALDYMNGLDDNYDAFEAVVVLPDVTGTITWTSQDASKTATALVIVEGLVDTAAPKYGAGQSFQDFNLTLTLPEGRTVVTP